MVMKMSDQKMAQKAFWRSWPETAGPTSSLLASSSLLPTKPLLSRSETCRAAPEVSPVVLRMRIMYWGLPATC